ncbi:MAG TPA: proline--tRNA ligase [Candidatus Limnocylindria bacterium]|nr:proline--tRNA ligase [Candidatus Limnocylindria bacterium]
MSGNRLPSQANDFPGWYIEVVRQAELAEHGPAKGSMIMKPHGYAIWELTQRALDDRFKATGHQNVYFPLLIPMGLLDREADHVEGFAPQVAVVTRGGGQELEEPLAIRPTSESIIWSTYKRWIQSYRDLPLLYNQWGNVVRWEMRTRLFLRTSEFLWQEGHTAHASAAEATEEALRMLEVYREVSEDVLGIPVIKGRKSAGERFPGAVETYCIEGLMRDAKALQCGTSHFLGQNFARAYDVTFLNADGVQEHAWATSWGFSTRMVGGTIMANGDDAGLRLPPAVAPVQVVIVPIYRSDEERSAVLSVADALRADLAGRGLRVRLDDRDQHRPGFKFAEWELKGVPLRVELGPRDVAANRAVVASRVSGAKEEAGLDALAEGMADRLASVQRELFADALAFREANTHEITSFDAFAAGVEERGGFWVGAWCGDAACEAEVSATTKATIRFLPLEPRDPGAACVHCGSPGTEVATWARAY